MPEATIYRITPDDFHWPTLLNEVPRGTAIEGLYVRGTLPSSDSLCVAVVGTRHPSSYGKEAARDIIKTLASHKNVAIVSGMALGIDTIAHETAIEHRLQTIAVLGSGIDERVIYPKNNIQLSRHIVEKGGALISEYEPLAHSERWTFPQRNRIIAGLSQAIIVIEAGEKSGALITGRLGAEYNRDVMALPGSIYSEYSRGSNLLIKEGAYVITRPNDVLDVLKLEHTQHIESPVQEDLTDDELKIFQGLSEEMPLDTLIQKTGLAPHTALATAASLEIRGIIKTTAAGTYRRISS